jgi:eukaryotic-like serine/threonine-protein kinase
LVQSEISLLPESSEPAPAAPGSLIAPGYRVVELLRRGEDLDVYDLWSDLRDCRCIGKKVRADRLDNRTVRRLRREGRMLVKFSHPHLVRAYEVTPGTLPMLVLETLPGETLGRLLERRRRLTVAEIAHLGLHLCSALGYLHRHRVLHLDLKPSNVISSCGVAKLLDLSVARAPGRVRGGTGTRGYMAPEQIAGGQVSASTDVWGLGALLYEVATGETACPVDDDHPDPAGPESRVSQPACSPPPIRLRRRLHGGLGEVIDASLANEASVRPSLEEVSAALARAARLEPGPFSPDWSVHRGMLRDRSAIRVI